MTIYDRSMRWSAALLGLAVSLAAVGLGVARAARVAAELPSAYELSALPAGLDTLTALVEADARLGACLGECYAVVYLWTPRMPLSRAGIPHVARAAEAMGVDLVLASHDELAAHAEAGPGNGDRAALADAMLAAGALAHAPSLVVTRRGRPVGAAILGYKSSAAYESALARRLAESGNPVRDAHLAALDPATARPLQVAAPRDYPVVGVPGAYFRWVPGRDAIAYESAQRVYLLDLDDGESRSAPGFIDFVPTPDGRFFVTPGEVEGGLTFYDAEQVFEATRTGRPGEVEPIFTDLRMRDQYPSVGILERDDTRTRYRVMTSWFEGVVYRDYDVRVDAPTGVASVRPSGEIVRPCVGVALSTPIMSPDGREVAGRDEATGTTKVWRILEGGRCDAVTDFGVATSKVAWHATGRRIAFAIPRRRRGGDEAERGIFVLDRETRELSRLPTSEGASRLAFPDFVGDDELVFLIPGGATQRGSVFRVVPLAP
jgi:hypothetical protein